MCHLPRDSQHVVPIVSLLWILVHLLFHFCLRYNSSTVYSLSHRELRHALLCSFFFVLFIPFYSCLFIHWYRLQGVSLLYVVYVMYIVQLVSILLYHPELKPGYNWSPNILYCMCWALPWSVTPPFGFHPPPHPHTHTL